MAKTLRLERTCYGGSRFCMATADSGYSEYTPGTDWSMECMEKKWNFDPFVDDVDKFAACLNTAQTCRKWKERKA